MRDGGERLQWHQGEVQPPLCRGQVPRGRGERLIVRNSHGGILTEDGTNGPVQAAYTELLAEGKDVESEELAIIYNNRGHVR